MYAHCVHWSVWQIEHAYVASSTHVQLSSVTQKKRKKKLHVDSRLEENRQRRKENDVHA